MLIFVKAATSRLRVVSRPWQRVKSSNYENALGETKPNVERNCRADPGLRTTASSQRQERIRKATDGLRQRYGVFGSLTTEPQIIDIRLGHSSV